MGMRCQACEGGRAKEEVERQAREEAERRAREKAERQAREEAERRTREETERRAREKAERQAREKAERRAREEAERRAREEAERTAREEAERQAREEAERRAREEAERQETRRVIKKWMKQHKFAELHQWLGQSRNQLEDLFAKGKVPVVGWLQLEENLQASGERKAKLEAQLDENTRKHEEIQQQIRALQEQQQELANRNEHIRKEINDVDQVLCLASEKDCIAMLGQKEKKALAQVELKMADNYFMENLQFEDVSAVFSMFEMDDMFSRFARNETTQDLEAIANGVVTDLQNFMELEFSEAVEMVFKLKLFESGEKGVVRHWNSCSICSRNAGLLLKEYGMNEDERNQIGEKIKDWKG